MQLTAIKSAASSAVLRRNSEACAKPALPRSACCTRIAKVQVPVVIRPAAGAKPNYDMPVVGQQRTPQQVFDVAEGDLRSLLAKEQDPEKREHMERVLAWFGNKRSLAEEQQAYVDGPTSFERLIRQLLMEGNERSMYRVLCSLEHAERTGMGHHADVAHDVPDQKQLAEVTERRSRLAHLHEAFLQHHGGVMSLAELQGGLVEMGLEGLDELDVEAIGAALGLADDETHPCSNHLGLEEFVALMEECERKGWGGARRWASHCGCGPGMSGASVEDGGTDVKFFKGVGHMGGHHNSQHAHT